MNMIDGYVEEVLSEPKYVVYTGFDWYFVKVRYSDEGGEHETDLMFDTMEKALDVKKGYVFLH